MSTRENSAQWGTNHQNNQKSAGPKTEQGKKIASRNAIIHGLHATDIVINSPHLKEDQSLYDQLVQSLFDELNPTGVLQEHLVLKIANCLWRYRRGINAESATIQKQVTPPSTGPEPLSEVGRYFQSLEIANHDANWYNAHSIPVGDTGLNLLRYKWRLDRELYRTYKLLRTLQKPTDSDKGRSPKKRC